MFLTVIGTITNLHMMMMMMMKSAYDTESHAPVNTPKRREHNLIYAAVNLTPEYN